MAQKPGILLDRDGTLIDVVRDEETGVVSVAFHPDHIRLLPGVVDGLTRLTAAGYTLCIASNQPGPAKGQFSAQAVQNTNGALADVLRAAGVTLASVQVCMHHPEGGPGGDASLIRPCDCRKPAPGLLLRAIAQHDLDPQKTWMLGDSPGDVIAAHAAGVRAGLVFPMNRCELCPLKGGPVPAPDAVAARFDDLVDAILKAAPAAVLS